MDERIKNILQGVSVNTYFLKNEEFKNNMCNNYEEFETILELETDLGFDDNYKDTMGVRVNVFAYQKENNDIDKHSSKNISELRFTYIFVFDVKNGSDELKDYAIKNANSEINDEIYRYILNIVYPYIKEHIETIYDRAKLPTTVPQSMEG